MGKRFVKKAIRKIKRALDPEVIRKEYVDTKGNIMQMILDVRPQKPNSPIIEWNRQYNKE